MLMNNQRLPALMCSYLIVHLYIEAVVTDKTHPMVSNTVVNIQDIVSLRSGSPDLHLHQSSNVD